MLSGSLIEGAMLTPLFVPIRNELYDTDIMIITHELSKEEASFILMKTPGGALKVNDLPDVRPLRVGFLSRTFT